MLRRQTRERRQYIYAKSLEAQERQTYQRKQQLKDALASGKALPTELRKDSKNLGKDLAYDEAQAGTCPSLIGVELPLILLKNHQATSTVNTRERVYWTPRSLSRHPETQARNFSSSRRQAKTSDDVRYV